MANLRIMPEALEKMKKNNSSYTLYMASRGG